MVANWQYKKIADVCSVLTDGNWIESKDQSPDGIRLIQTGNIGNGVFKDKGEKARYISEETFERLSCTEIFEGDVLVSRLPEPIGRSCILPKLEQRTVTAVDCSILRFKKDLLNKFFVYFTLSPAYDRALKNYITGSSRKRISRSNLGLIKVPVPPIEDQQRIVDELDLLTGIIEKKNAQLRDLDTLAQSIFYEMFGNIIANEKKWPFGRIADICAPRSSIKRASKSYLPSDSIEYIDISSIDNKRQKLTGTTAFIFSDAPSRAQQVVQYEDVLISMVRPNLKNIAVVDLDHNRLVASSGFCVLRANNRSNSSFIKSFIGTDAFTQHLMDRVTGANYPAVKEDDIKGCRIGVPPVDLQRQFAERAAVIERQKQLISSAIDEVGRLLSGRMDLYFNE